MLSVVPGEGTGGAALTAWSVSCPITAHSKNAEHYFCFAFYKKKKIISVKIGTDVVLL